MRCSPLEHLLKAVPDSSPPRYRPVPGAQADSQHGVCVCRLMCVRQVTAALCQLPVRLWGLHKHLHHLFSRYHQHHTYYLEDSCQLQLKHHFSWPGEGAGVQTCSPISNQMSPLTPLFLSSTVSAPYFRWKTGIPKEGMHGSWLLLSYPGLCFLKSSVLQTTLIFNAEK